MSKAAEDIHRILGENCSIFAMESNTSQMWLNYKKYVDDIVCQAMLSAVGCR